MEHQGWVARPCCRGLPQVLTHREWPSYILASGLGFLVLTVSGETEIPVYMIHRMCQGGSVKPVSVKYVYIHKFLWTAETFKSK